MEKKVLGGLFQINPVTKTGQRLYMVRVGNARQKLFRWEGSLCLQKKGKTESNASKHIKDHLVFPLCLGSHASSAFPTDHRSYHPSNISLSFFSVIIKILRNYLTDKKNYLTQLKHSGENNSELNHLERASAISD